MARAATVLVPTHSHGPLLRLAVESALAQTVADIEVLIVADGPTADTEDTARALQRSDDRVQVFTHPKGEGHGEAHRHEALQRARGKIVCYLSDDDLWLPDHVEYLSSLLDGNDFAHSLGVRVSPDGTLRAYPGDLSIPSWRAYLMEGGNFIPLHTAGHTMELYRRLPHGWRPAPEGVWSDAHMWRQILAVPGCRAVTGRRPTSLHLTSNRRQGVATGDRLAEMTRWASRVADPVAREGLRLDILDALALQLAESAGRDRARRARMGRDEVRHRRLADKLERRVERAVGRAERAEAKLASVQGSRTWRLRSRLLRLPLIARLARRAGRARSRR